MKIRLFLSSILLLFTVIVYGQQGSCVDSSFRMRYIFGDEGATFYNIPDTVGTNIFAGYFRIGARGIPLMKTTWGDSVLWARQISLTGYIHSAVPGPDGSIIVCGPYGDIANKAELFVSRIDSNGRVKWMKKVTTKQPFTAGIGGVYKNINIANNAIYLEVDYDSYDITAKLDMDGNIIWSRGMTGVANSPNIAKLGRPVYSTNAVLCLGSYYDDPPHGSAIPIITKLNDTDGSPIESWGYRTVPNAAIFGIVAQTLKANGDNTTTVAGYMTVPTPGGGPIGHSSMMSNTLLDANLNPIHNYYYRNTAFAFSFGTGFGVELCFNNKKQLALLADESFISSGNEVKYLTMIGKNGKVLRSRKFTIPHPYIYSSLYSYSINLDDKENVHFLYQYPQGSKVVNEYGRISNVTVNNSLDCFGKDTSILTQVPFVVNKEPFVWPNTNSNLLQSLDVPYYEDTAFVTKELVCKIASLCNRLTISGPANACVSQPVRYTITRNNGCYKNADWSVDTTVASILSIEGDSAIILSFKKIFKGYIHAALTDCVVKDSFLVNITAAPIVSLIKRDSVLCPGKPLTLTAATGFTNYQWQDGSTGVSYIVNKPGLYKVSATSYCGTVSADSITVTNSDTSFAITTAQTICLYDTALIVLPNDVTGILWQPTTNSLLHSKTLLLYPQQNTVYTINVERMLNCTLVKNTSVAIKICPQTFFMPNSFTPNNDNRNDIFKPSVSLPLAFYHMQIFNRYGQTIFESNNQYNGWDGTYKGSRQPMGGYIYQCTYRFNNSTPKTVNGYFILIR